MISSRARSCIGLSDEVNEMLSDELESTGDDGDSYPAPPSGSPGETRDVQGKGEMDCWQLMVRERTDTSADGEAETVLLRDVIASV
jgi:hypothetical protein